MAKVKIQGHASGTGILTVTAPNTSTNRTITLPDETATIATTTDISTRLPSGIIVMWSGAVSAVPSGWAICDGNNSTPNLTDRFVIHADADSGGTFDVGDTGGSHTATPLGSLGTSGATTLAISEIPSHDHDIKTGSNHLAGSTTAIAWSDGTLAGPYVYRTGESGAYVIGGGGSHTHSGGTFTGSSTTVTPKYYALAYIMKT